MLLVDCTPAVAYLVRRQEVLRLSSTTQELQQDREGGRHVGNVVDGEEWQVGLVYETGQLGLTEMQKSGKVYLGDHKVESDVGWGISKFTGSLRGNGL